MKPVPRGVRRLLLAACLAAACLAAAPAWATSYVMISDEALVEGAELVVEARILSGDPAPATRLPAQDYMIEVERVIAGEPAGRNLVVRVPGGRSPEGLVWHVEGVPQFAAGERVLLFLSPRADGTYGVRHLMLGAFHEAVSGGERLFVRDLAGARELGGQASGRDLYRHARKADAFSRWVGDRARGVEREPDYFVEAREADVLSSVTGAFRLFESSLGINMRWFDFDEGGDVVCNVFPPITIRRGQTLDFFIVNGGQPGFDVGQTANAMRTAIGTWNGVSRTNIRYRYGGTIPSSPGFEGCPDGQAGGVCLDGRNAVLYANADGSIDEDFDCGPGGGGTLAIGGPIYEPACTIPGPNGRSFHPSFEAEIITNKNIECILRSQRDLEQLFAHELGHTLGIHHPCQTHPCGTPVEKEALMYPIFHDDGRGAQLNQDDIAAARFLYPGDTPDSGQPPEAPTGLAADPQSPTSVGLAWTDNSSTESSFRIEASQDGVTFARVGTAGANETSFVVTGLTPGTAYVFRVQARNGAGGSAFATVTVATPPDLPAAPGNLVAAPDSSSAVGLTWDDHATDETGFRIEMRSPLTGAWTEVGLAAADTETFIVPGLVSERPYTFRVIAVNGAGESAPSNSSSATPLPAGDPPCEDADTTVCLLDRFRVTVQWNNPHGAGGNGPGHLERFDGSPQTARAWFFSPDNVELIVKMLDGSTVNEFFWVFHGQLTDVEFWITVLDTESGFSRTYHNPPFDQCGEFDTAALPVEEIPFEESTFAPASAAGPFAALPAAAIDEETGACVPDDTTLCLLGGRFAVEVDWTNQHDDDATGVGHTIPGATSDRTGYFWFFKETNVELVVKVLQAGDTFWVFYGSLSDVGYELRVTDTVLDRTKAYVNAPGNQCGQFDTAAFPPPDEG